MVHRTCYCDAIEAPNFTAPDQQTTLSNVKSIDKKICGMTQKLVHVTHIHGLYQSSEVHVENKLGPGYPRDVWLLNASEI